MGLRNDNVPFFDGEGRVAFVAERREVQRHGPLSLIRLVQKGGAGGDGQQALAQGDEGKGRGVHRHEAPAVLYGYGGGGAAAGEEITHQVPRLGGGQDDPLQQGFRFLRGVAQSLLVLLLQVFYIRPNVRRIDEIVLIIGVQLAVGADGEAHPSVLVHELLHVVAAFRPPGLAYGGDVEIHLAALAIEEDGVMLAREEAGGPAAGLVAPDDLVHEVVLAEDLVQQEPELGAHAPVDMQVEAPGGGEKGVAAGEDGPHPFEILPLGHVVPKQGDVLFSLALEGVPRAEGRIQIDELDLAAVLPDQGRQLLLGTGQKEGPGAAYVVMFRLAIDPHRTFLRSSISTFYNTRYCLSWQGGTLHFGLLKHVFCKVR